MFDPMLRGKYISPRDYARKGAWSDGEQTQARSFSGTKVALLLLIAVFIGLRLLGISIP